MLIKRGLAEVKCRRWLGGVFERAKERPATEEALFNGALRGPRRGEEEEDCTAVKACGERSWVSWNREARLYSVTGRDRLPSPVYAKTE